MLKRADGASWFEWKDGSALVFLHWHDLMREARDGFPTQFLENQLRQTPKKVYPLSIPKDHKVKALIEDKLNRILQVRYLLRGYVHWDIIFFNVPKSLEDIRLVYDGTKNGINSVVWAPTFFLPTSMSLSRLLQPNTYKMDMDIGEMFHNFVLNKDIKAYSGVNVSRFKLEAALLDHYR